MHQINQFVDPVFPQPSSFQADSTYTLKLGSLVMIAQIDQELRINIKDLKPEKIFQLKAQCLMSPHFQGKQVSSIVIHFESESMSLSGCDGLVNKLYFKLSRVLAHRGFSEYYKPMKRLGRGTFATVYLVEHKATGVKRAAKVFSKEGQKIEYKGKQALENEIKTLREIDHPNLIQYDGLYQTDSLVYLVTEYLSGGTLQNTLKNKMSLGGEQIQKVLSDILSGLAYLDENKIMHRDIKPENVILRQKENQWVIGDFGLAARSNEDYLYDKCGTMGYIAPEIMGLQENQKYAQACDTYSLGVIAYQMIVGELPFKVESINVYDKKVHWILFDREECKDINPQVLSFLKGLLDSNPLTRTTPKQALSSPFFKNEEVVGELIAFHERRRQARYDRILKMVNSN